MEKFYNIVFLILLLMIAFQAHLRVYNIYTETYVTFEWVIQRKLSVPLS